MEIRSKLEKKPLRLTVLFPAKRVFGVLIAVLVLLSCNQDAIFYTISLEHAPTEARIPGPTTKMAVFPPATDPNPAMYAASSSLHEYSGGKWRRISKPNGKIVDLAATSSHLYVLTFTGTGTSSAKLWRSGNPGNNWEEIGLGDAAVAGYGRLQSIFGDEDRLFVCGWNGNGGNDGNNYGIFYVDDTNPLNPVLETLIPTSTRYLTGVASGTDTGTDYFYLSTAGMGVYAVKSDLTSVDPVRNSASNAILGNITGIINLDKPNDHTSAGPIAAITRGGDLYTISGTTATKTSIEMNQRTKRTQSLAIWTNPDTSAKLLLVSFRGSSSTYGYGEITLDSGLNPIGKQNPGGTLSSTPHTTNAEYQNSIGKHSIIHLFQAPQTVDPDMTLFAATEQNGLWSYRNRSDGWQWNMEE